MTNRCVGRSMVLAICLCMHCPATGTGNQIPLVRDGQARATIVVLTDHAACRDAARELQEFLALMSTAKLEIVEGPADVRTTRVQIGLIHKHPSDPMDGRLPKAVLPALQRVRPEGFVLAGIAGNPASVSVLAADEPGLWHGVYELLEQLGCRWYFPGDAGQHVPRRKDLGIPAKVEVQNPDFVLRNVWWVYGGRPKWQTTAHALWNRRNKMGGVQAGMAHNLHRIVPPSKYGRQHEAYFPLRSGKRYVPKRDTEQGWQPCTSNPEVIRLAAEAAIRYFDKNPKAYTFSLSPADGYGWCECPRCTAQDPPELRGTPRRGKGRRMTLFANEVAQRLAEKHPDKYVCWYAYAGAVEAPADLKVHPNVVISLAHYGWCGCNIHALTDPQCKFNVKFLPILDAWSERTDKLFIREYWTVIVPAVESLSRICGAYSLADDIPVYRAKGAIGFSSEAVPDYGSAALNYWLAAKKLWNAEADTKSLLDDFYEGMYGPAAAVMRKHFETIVQTCRTRGDRPPFFTDEDLDRMRPLLEKAIAQAKTEKQKQRVQLTRDHFDYVVAMRDYSVAPTREKRDAINRHVNALVARRSLAVDPKAHAARFAPRSTLSAGDFARYCGAGLRPFCAAPMPKGAEKRGVVVRGRHGFVILLRPGEELRGEVQVRRLGRYLSPCRYLLLGPDGKTVAEGEAFVDKPACLSHRSANGGTHVLVTDSGRNACRALLENQYVCLVAKGASLLGQQPKTYFLAEPEAQEATVVLSSDASGDPSAPGETAMMTITDPTGKEIARGDTVSGKPFAPTFKVPVEYRAKPWGLLLSKAPKGAIEDLRIQLGKGCVEFLATHPSRLLMPNR